MLITNQRTILSPNSTIGKLSIDTDSFTCFIMEPVDRGLAENSTLEQIQSLKHQFPDKVAISPGKYRILINYSPKFGKAMPLINNVLGFEGVRVHPGNKPYDTIACSMPGLQNPSDDWIARSDAAFTQLFAIIQNVINAGKPVWWQILPFTPAT
jgi:hypothetical protein